MFFQTCHFTKFLTYFLIPGQLSKTVAYTHHRLWSFVVDCSQKIGSIFGISTICRSFWTWRSSANVQTSCEKTEGRLLKLQSAEIFRCASRSSASTFSRIRNFYRRVRNLLFLKICQKLKVVFKMTSSRSISLINNCSVITHYQIFRHCFWFETKVNRKILQQKYY